MVADLEDVGRQRIRRPGGEERPLGRCRGITRVEVRKSADSQLHDDACIVGVRASGVFLPNGCTPPRRQYRQLHLVERQA